MHGRSPKGCHGRVVSERPLCARRWGGGVGSRVRREMTRRRPWEGPLGDRKRLACRTPDQLGHRPGRGLTRDSYVELKDMAMRLEERQASGERSALMRGQSVEAPATTVNGVNRVRSVAMLRSQAKKLAPRGRLGRPPSCWEHGPRPTAVPRAGPRGGARRPVAVESRHREAIQSERAMRHEKTVSSAGNPSRRRPD